jgi:hypothetical protein
MKKYFCDKCDKEIKDDDFWVELRDFNNEVLEDHKWLDVCKECFIEVANLLLIPPKE